MTRINRIFQTFQTSPFRSGRACLRRGTCAVTALSVIASSTFVFPMNAGAQTTPPADKTDQKTDTTEKSDQTQTDKTSPSTAAPVKRMPPPPNPTVLYSPKTGTGNRVGEYAPDGTKYNLPAPTSAHYGDYRLRPTDMRGAREVKLLPLFGYDYFAPARDDVAMRREQYRRSLEDDGLPGSYSSGSSTLNGRSFYGSSRSQNSGSSRNDLSPRRPINGSGAGNANGYGTDDPFDDGTSITRRPRRAAGANGDISGNDGSNGTDASGQDTMGRTRSADGTGGRTNGGDPNVTDNSSNGDSTMTDRAAAAARGGGSNAALGAAALGAGALGSGGLGAIPGTGRTSAPALGDNGYYDTAPTRLRTRRLSPLDDYGTPYSNYNDYPQSSYGAYDDYGRPRRPDQDALDARYNVADPLSMRLRNISASPPTNYQISGGDIITVRITTRTLPPREETLTVDQQGALMLPEAGRINVRGKTLDQAEKALQLQLKRYYKNPTVTLTLAALRTMSVSVLGAAVQPGTYLVPANYTAFNLLYQAGGPTQDGSLRDIKVVRHGKTIGTFDYYKTVIGVGQEDITLQPGDVLSVLPTENRISLSGEVRRPARYELRDGETLKDLLRYANGVKASGATQSVQITTFDPGQSRLFHSVDLRDTAAVASLKLFDGDSVEVNTLRDIITNKVTIVGAVEQPSDYELRPGMKVSDLVRNARNPLSEAYLGRADLYRWEPDGTTTIIPIDLMKAIDGDPTNDLTLAKWDKLEVYTRAEALFVGTRRVQVRGSVQRPGDYEFSKNMRLTDILLKSGGPLPDADMVVLVHQRGDGTYKQESVSIADIVHSVPGRDLLLEDNDIVGIYSNAQSHFIPIHEVQIAGQVLTPGIYPRGEGMRVSDLLKYAGGFLPDAGTEVVIGHARRALDGPQAQTRIETTQFDIHHQSARDVLLEDGDIVAVQGVGGIQEKPILVDVRGAVNKTGPILLTSKTVRLSEVIRQAGGLRPEGFAEGAQFFRNPATLIAPNQRELTLTISQLSNLLNDSKYKRELAKSDIERIKAASGATDGGGIGSSTPNIAGAAAATALSGQLAQHELVTPPRRLTSKELEPYGNLAINLPEALRKPGGGDDILVVDGDTINIPETPTMIPVVGAVVVSVGVPYLPGKNLGYYIAHAGGFAPDAATDRIVVIHAGGGLEPGSKVKTLRPGDLIMVPTKVLAERISGGSNVIGDFFKSLTNSAILFKLATGIFGL